MVIIRGGIKQARIGGIRQARIRLTE
jgi:hypothetical protein